MKICTQFTRLNEDDSTLKGVVLAEVGEAAGHSFYIDESFLKQLAEVCNEKGVVKVRANHPEEGKSADVLSIVGEATNFRVDTSVNGNLCVRADVKLFNVPQKDALLALAKEAPQHFGMSLDFQGTLTKKKVKGLATITCEEVHAVDFVESPAAVTALFSKNGLTGKQDGGRNRSTGREKSMGRTKFADDEKDERRQTAADESEKDGDKSLAEQLAELTKAMTSCMSRLDAIEKDIEEKMNDKNGDKDDEKLDDEKKDGDENKMSEKTVARIAARVTSIYLEKVGIDGRRFTSRGGNEGFYDDEPKTVFLSERERGIAMKLALGKGKDDERIYAERLAKLPANFRETCVELELDPDKYREQLANAGQI